MYQATGPLPHLLAPNDYFSPEQAAREAEGVFRGAWTLVGAMDQIPLQNDFLTCTILGRSLIVHHVDGGIRTFANVCAHRHCMLEERAKGSARRLICPYHGWRYDPAGRVSKAPEAGQFKADVPTERPALHRYRTELCGRLIFVQLDETGPTLAEFLGDLHAEVGAWFGDDYRLSMALDRPQPANWKVPVENAMEAYHAASLHPRTFGGDPAEERMVHRLLPGRTELLTTLNPDARDRRLGRRLYQRLVQLAMAVAGRPATGAYRVIHLFPNLAIDVTDGQAVILQVDPTSPTTSTRRLWQFNLAGVGASGWRRGLLRLWAWIEGRVILTIFREDEAIYSRVQRGLQASTQKGILGRSEERVHAFQQWVVERTGGPRG